MLVEKEVIGPGIYWYMDEKTNVPRKWEVTSATTKYLNDQGNKMIALGLPVPIPCEHDFNSHPMTPRDKLLGNAGEVRGYSIKDVDDPLEPGGKRKDVLFSVCDIQDEAVARKIPKTIRWTSPWISSFTDGSGREWNNVIAHLALTTRPRVTKQAPFPSIAAAMAFAMSAPADTFDITRRGSDSGFTVSRAGRLVLKDKKLRPQYPMAFSLLGGVALADNDPPSPKSKKVTPEETDDDMPENVGGEGEGGGEGEVPDLGGEGEAVPPPDGATPPGSDFGDQVGDVQMEEVLADLLGALGIHLERSGGGAMFKRSLYNAAMTKIHELTNSGQGAGPDTTNQPPPPTGQGNQTPPNPLIHQEQQPMYMSLQDINKIEDPTMKHIAMSMYQENVKLRGELDANAKTTASLRDAELKKENAKRQVRVAYLGRMSPRVKQDLDAMLAMPSMALSMGDGGAVVDPMAQTLAVLEKGLQDMPKLLTTDRAAFAEQPQPTDADMLTAEKADEIADGMARMMGAPPEQKKAG